MPPIVRALSRRLYGLLLALALGLTASCSGDGSGKTGSTAPCIDGATQPCACTDIASGTQTCGGGVFGACQCLGTPFADVALDSASPDTASPDTGLLPDAPAADAASACPGGAGCACSQNVDCLSTLCIDDPLVEGGRSCARTCVDACPDGYSCAQVTTASGDVVSICVARFGHLCDPCATSKDCASLGLKDPACVDQGPLGRFCGVSCASAADCPADYACQKVATAEGGALSQCVRKADASQQPFGVCPCSPPAVQKNLATACQASTASGSCPGQRTCTAQGLTPCTAPAAKPETCNGLDDDCNGQTDEGTCDDKNACTKDTCDAKAGTPAAPGQCVASAMVDGTPCDADGSLCTAGDSCQAGKCSPGKLKNCDDKNPCTADACNPASGCTQTADDGVPCDEDNPCTIGDVCGGGSCAPGKPKECVSGKPCVAAECDLGQGGKCSFTNKKAGASCDDGDACTTGDGCQDGACEGQKQDCDDGNPCTSDSCDKANGCVHAANTAGCDDGNACTVADACAAGQCVAGASQGVRRQQRLHRRRLRQGKGLHHHRQRRALRRQERMHRWRSVRQQQVRR